MPYLARNQKTEVKPAWSDRARGRDLAVIERLLAVPLWALKTEEELARQLGCSAGGVRRLLKRTPFLAEMRLWRRLRPADMAGIARWKTMEPEAISKRLSLPVEVVEKFFLVKPEMKGGPFAKRAYKIKTYQRIKIICSIPGWRSLPLDKIAPQLGVSTERLRQLVERDADVADLFRLHKRCLWGWTREKVEEVHAKFASAEDSAFVMGLTLFEYRKVVKKLGLVRQPPKVYVTGGGLRYKLEALPGWGNFSYDRLAKKLKISANWICHFVHRNPDLLAKRVYKNRGPRPGSPPLKRSSRRKIMSGGESSLGLSSKRNLKAGPSR